MNHFDFVQNFTFDFVQNLRPTLCNIVKVRHTRNIIFGICNTWVTHRRNVMYL